MKVALTVWEDRISPVFDSAHILLIAEIKDAEVITRHNKAFKPEMTSHLTEMLINFGIEVVICGAISEIPANIIEASGLTLIPFIAGNVEEVLESYAKGIQIVPTFLMPGCGCNQQQKRKRRNNNQRREVSTMPKRDGTGPQGQGSGSGKGRGGFTQGKSGKGSGRGQGCGTGQGKGGRKNNGSKK